MVALVLITGLSLFITLFITYLTNNYIINLINLEKIRRLKLEAIIIFYAISIFLVYWLTKLTIGALLWSSRMNAYLLNLILILPFAWFIYFTLINRKKILKIITSKWN